MDILLRIWSEPEDKKPSIVCLARKLNLALIGISMKIHLLILLVYLGLNSAKSQTTFNKTYDFDSISNIIYTAMPADDGYILIGNGFDDDTWIWRIELAKIDLEGNIIWSKMYGEPGVDFAPWFWADEFPDGSIGFAGLRASGDSSDIYIFKFDPDTGDSLFSKIVDIEGEQQGACIRGLENGDMIISAFTADPMQGIYFIKTDSLGNVIWENDYSAGGALDWCGYFDMNSANLITYVSVYDPCFYGFRMNEIDTSGATVYTSVIGDGCVTLSKRSINEGFLVWGVYSLDYSQSYIARLDMNLDSIWNYRTSIRDDSIGFIEGQVDFTGYEELEDGSIVGAGFYETYDNYGYHAFISKTNAEGEELWIRQYATDENHTEGWTYNLLAANDGGFLLSGTGDGPPLDEWGHPNQNFWALKLDSMGCLIPGCDSLDVSVFELPSDEAGLLIYPNPVSSEAIIQITFHNPQELNQLEIKLFDMSGRCVSSQLVDDVVIDGDKMRFGFERGNLVSGIYLMEINSGGELVGGGKVVLR